MKLIPLNVGRWKRTEPTKFALVNDRDFARVNRHKWTAVKMGNSWYAHTMAKVGGRWRVIKMHNMVLGFPGGIEAIRRNSRLIDHRDLNGLNNQRGNLRLATRSQNAANSAGHRDRKSKHKGVSFEGFTKRWLAQLTVNGKMVFKARFDTEAQAGRAYKAAVRCHCGKFGRHS